MNSEHFNLLFPKINRLFNFDISQLALNRGKSDYNYLLNR